MQPRHLIRLDLRGALAGADADPHVRALRARHCLDLAELLELAPALERARQEVLDDVAVFERGGPVPPEKQPLDAGFVRLPEQLLNEGPPPENTTLARIRTAADALAAQVDRVVSLGIGGSYMGARALFEALCDPLHNELSRDERRDRPRLYFEGNNVDNDTLEALLDLLTLRSIDPSDLAQRWGLVVISKSGGTLETAVAFRLFLQAAEKLYGGGSEELKDVVLAVTGRTGRLRAMAEARGLRNVFSIPEGVGGRFSVFTPVGLLPAAIVGIDVFQLLEGAAAMTRRFVEAPVGENPVLDYVAVAHPMERTRGATIRVLSTWSSRLEALGLWYDQLLAESLGKHEQGATPVTAVNTRDLHSRGQQHQEGRRDKLITNLVVERPAGDRLEVPHFDLDHDHLNRLAGRTVPELLDAALKGTNLAYYQEGRPTVSVILPRLDEFTMGQLLQMLMLATVVEGRLIGINPYGQPGVEAYKRHMQTFLAPPT